MRRFLPALLLAPTAAAQNNTTADPMAGDPVAGGALGQGARGLVSAIVERGSEYLPEALQGPVPAFILTLLVWAALAFLLVMAFLPALRWVARHTPGEIDNVILGIVGKPLFYLLFVYGVVDSFLALDLPTWADTVLLRLWKLVVVIQITYIVYRVWHEVLLELGRVMAKKTESQLDDKLYPLFNKVGGVIIILAGIWIAVSSLGIDMTFFAAGGAIGGLVVAFAAQDTLANFFAGIHILVDRPFREGDRIEIKEENTWGDVVDIGLRSTRIRTRDNRMVIVPNMVIASNPVINHSFPDSTYRIGVDVGVAYGSDVEKVRDALIAALDHVDDVMHTERKEALLTGFGASSIDFHVRAWFPTYVDKKRYEDKMLSAIYQALAEAGIEIPFPQMVLWNGAKPDAGVVA